MKTTRKILQDNSVMFLHAAIFKILMSRKLRGKLISAMRWNGTEIVQKGFILICNIRKSILYTYRELSISK